IGGTESHLDTLAKELTKEMEVAVLASSTGLKTCVENNCGVNIVRLATAGKVFSQPLTFVLPFWLKKLRADILHFHLPNPFAVISYFITRPSGKLVVSYHSDIIRQRLLSFLFNPLLLKFLGKSEAIIVSSRALIDNSSVLRKFRGKCRVLPHGIDLSKFSPQEAVLKKAQVLRTRFGSPLLLFVGRLVYYKGLEYLIRAMREIDARLLIVGEGPLKNKLKKLSRKLCVNDKITWLGEVPNEDVSPYYYACDVFVLPSSIRAESFGIVQLEAFACARPVVSTALPTGVPFVNIDGHTGLVVKPRDYNELALAINKLLKAPQLRNALGKNGKERVRAEFTKEKMSDGILKLYKDLMQQNSCSID
ncbi:MAG: glycosyltransferase, partial [Candidatus Omnitrophota bacterium]